MSSTRIVLGYFGDHWFQSAGGSHKKLSIHKLQGLLGEFGVEAELVRIDNIRSTEERPIYYTSSEVPEIRGWIIDHLSSIRELDLRPEYDLLLAHENKGYQSIVSKLREIDQPETLYLHHVNDARLREEAVAKTVDGAGSAGVFRVNSEKDIKKMKGSIRLSRYMRAAGKWATLRNQEFENYWFKHSGHKRFIVQEYLPGLDGDYKVLIFHDRYYFLKRHIKKGDFRASGSGLTEKGSPSIELLDFAKKVKGAFRTPYFSLDIAISGGSPKLIEFQALNFGPSTLWLVDEFYKLEGSKWTRSRGSNDIEENFAYAISEDLKCTL